MSTSRKQEIFRKSAVSNCNSKDNRVLPRVKARTHGINQTKKVLLRGTDGLCDRLKDGRGIKHKRQALFIHECTVATSICFNILPKFNFFNKDNCLLCHVTACEN